MKEKAVGLVGTIIGIVGYLLLKELFVQMGLSSFMAIFMAIASMIAIVFVVALGINYISSFVSVVNSIFSYSHTAFSPPRKCELCIHLSSPPGHRQI